MKKILLKTFLLSISIGLLLGSCKKNLTYKGSGTIVGWNNGFCSTCGGFYLNLSQDTVFTPASYYVLQYDPSVSAVITTLHEQYNKDHRPIGVLLNWEPLVDAVYGYKSLKVTALAKK